MKMEQIVFIWFDVIWFKRTALRRPAKACLVQLCTVVPAKPIFAKAPKIVCDVTSSFIIRNDSVIRSSRDIRDLQWQDKLPFILYESQAILSGSNFLWSGSFEENAFVSC